MKCNVTGCPNRARFTMSFSAYALGLAKRKQSRTIGNFDGVVCESHKNSLTLRDLMTDGGWSDIQSKLLTKGRPLLDRNTLELHFEAMH